MLADEKPRGLDEEAERNDTELNLAPRPMREGETHAAWDELQGERQPPLDCALLSLQNTAE